MNLSYYDARPPWRIGRLAFRPLLALAAFDFLAPAILIELGNAQRDYSYFALLLLGAIAGQLLLLSVWAVFGAASFWRRWLSALIVLAALYAAWLAGIAVDDVFREDLHVYAANLFLLPLLFLCAQLPLWPLRLSLGRGLRHEDMAVERRRGIQFQTRDLFTVLAVVAVALGLARLTVLLYEVNDREGAAPWMDLAAACVFFGAWGVFVLAPSVWAAFLARRRGVASLAACIVVLVIGVGSSVSLWFVVGGVLSDILLTFLSFHAGLLAVTLAGCQMLCSWGYSLRHANPPNIALHRSLISEAGSSNRAS